MIPVGQHPAGRDRRVRVLWNLGGAFFVVLGVLGALLPVLPAVPFLLLATACTMRGSPRMHRWITTNRYFGRQLADYTSGRGLPAATKAATIAGLWIGIVMSVTFVVENAWGRAAMLVVAGIVTIHVASVPTRTQDLRSGQDGPGDDRDPGMKPQGSA